MLAQKTASALPMASFAHTPRISTTFATSPLQPKRTLASHFTPTTSRTTTSRSLHRHLRTNAANDAAAANSASKKPIGNPSSLPASTKEQVDQAFNSIKAAYEAGKRRQQVEFTLPLIGATDLDDWPGGIRQQFKAAAPMVESLLKQLKSLPGLEGSLAGRIIDDADAVGSWTGDTLAAIVFPTAETIKDLQSIVDKNPNGLTIMVNPQWTSNAGQVISDFGILPWKKKAAEELIASFTETYCLKQLRINGDNVRWLLTGGAWQVSVVTGPGQAECILQSLTRPTYQEVQDKLRSLSWTMSSKGLFERIAAEAEFNRKSSMRPPPNGQ